MPKPQNPNVDHLMDELDRLLNRTRKEYDMTYAEVIGCLQVKIMELHDEGKGGGDE